MKIRFLIILVLALVSLSGSYMQTALAQSGSEPTGLKNVTLWLNPEYDDPRLLVMLEGKIVGVNPPARIRFLVPTAAEMYSAGSKDATGKYTGGPPDRKASEIPGWDEISYELKTDTFRVEYYDSIIVGQPDKEISYYFEFLYPISDLSVVIQEPRKSTDFKVTPEGTTGKDQEAFTMHRYSYSNLVPASPLHFDIAYTKSDPHPSLSIDAIDSGASPTDSTGSSSPVNVPLMVGIIAGVCA
ncbi:MAG: hypothetical protein Q7U96_04410, partial [Chloroflexota bacterium]|nr:hypothetical protein [Chloroflexota bacterium]